jgi:hypothetical protein
MNKPMDRTEDQLVLLPRRRQLGLFRWDGSDAEELAVVGAPAWAPTKLDRSSGYLATLTNDGKKVRAWNLDDDELGEPVIDRKLPERNHIHAMQFVGDQLYLGSEFKRYGILWRTSVEKPDNSWEMVDVPEEVISAGKAVDGFDLRDGRLLAIDNIVLPKYFLTFDVEVPGDPQLEEAVEMPDHGTYEGVFTADSNASWVVIGSGSVGRGGVSRHISFVEPATLRESAVLKYATSKDPSMASFGDSPDFPVDLAVTDEYLYLARGSTGVEAFDIQDILDEAPEPPEAPGDVRGRGPRPIDVSEVPSQMLKLDSDAKVLSVQTAPGQEGCFATLKFDKLEHGWEWLTPNY